MLLSAGYSLGSALNRLARRGNGACARDLARVRARIHQGLSEVAALREWAELAQVDALHRLVAVVALNTDAADLGRLVSDEAEPSDATCSGTSSRRWSDGASRCGCR